MIIRAAMPIALSFLFAACADSCADPLAARECVPGKVRCEPDGDIAVCSTAGRWLASVCPLGERCGGNACGGTLEREEVCRPVQCVLGQTRCSPTDQVRIETCDESGTAWCCQGSCATVADDGVCYDGNCVSVCAMGDKSYIGCEYFAVDLDNAYVPFCDRDENGNIVACDAAAAQFAVVLSNPDPENETVFLVTTGPTEIAADLCAEPANVAAAGVLPPSGLAVVDLPRRDANGTLKAQLAYRVASNAPITAYQFNPLENVDVFSNDASLLLPANTAGTDYLIMTREQTFDDLKGFLTVVGIDAEPTSVTVRVTAKTLAGPGIPQLVPNGLFTTTLNRYDVLNIETNEIGGDLTGSLVTADRPVIVYGGSEAANAPNTSRCDLDTGTCEWDHATPCACTASNPPACNPHQKCSDFITCCADHLEQQMFPLATWGSEYIGVRSMPRGSEQDVWRILAAEDDTHVTVEPPLATVPTLAAFEWFEFESDVDFRLQSDKPVLLGQFLAAQQAPAPGSQSNDAKTGNPAFMLAVPTRQFRTDYVFLAPNKYAWDYVSIGARADTEVRIDGRAIESLSPEVECLQIAEVGETGWHASRALIADGVHILTCAEPCSVMVHGYNQYVSYGYPGGLNLEE